MVRDRSDVGPGGKTLRHPAADRTRRRWRTRRARAAREIAQDAARQAGAFIDQRGIELDQARAGADAGIGFRAAVDPADRDQRSAPPVAVRKSASAARELASGAPDRPLAQPASGRRADNPPAAASRVPPAAPRTDRRLAGAGGPEGSLTVVLPTISASIPASIAARAMSSICAGSRSGATFRNSGVAPARRRRRARAGRPARRHAAGRAGPACWAS